MTRMDTYMAPDDLCRQHLLSNHKETHDLAGFLRSGKVNKLLGHAARGQIDLTQLRQWHDAVAREMGLRGYQHNSPLDYSLDVPIGAGSIGRASTRRVDERCGACRERMGIDTGELAV